MSCAKAPIAFAHHSVMASRLMRLAHSRIRLSTDISQEMRPDQASPKPSVKLRDVRFWHGPAPRWQTGPWPSEAVLTTQEPLT